MPTCPTFDRSSSFGNTARKTALPDIVLSASENQVLKYSL
jgi:hypothetical protein